MIAYVLSNMYSRAIAIRNFKTGEYLSVATTSDFDGSDRCPRGNFRSRMQYFAMWLRVFRKI